MFSTFRSLVGVVAAWSLFCSAASAQTAGTAVDDAARESIRRQANKVDVRAKIAKAQEAEKAGRNAEAARLYEECLKLLKGINSGVDAELAAVNAGMGTSRLALAMQAQRAGDLLEAEKQVDRVLVVDPSNKAAQDFRQNVELIKAKLAGRMPSPETLAQLPEIAADKAKLSTKLQDAKVLVEAGRLTEAEAKLNELITADPGNQGAYYYLNIIREQRHQSELLKREGWAQGQFARVTEAWMDPNTRAKLPHPNNPYVGTNLVNTSRSRQLIYSKLRRIKVDEVKFESKSLSEVLKDLYNESQKRDPDKSGLNFLLAPNVDLPTPVPTLDAQGNPVPTPAAAEGAPILGDVIINIPTPLKGLTIAEMLDAIVRVADRPIKYSVEDYAIIFSFRNRDGDQLQTRTFRVDPNTFRQGLESVSASTFASEGGGGSSGGGGGGRSGGGGGSRGGQGGQGGQQQQQLGSTFANIAIAPFVGGVGGGLGGFGGAVGGVAAGGISSNPQTYTGELGNPGSGVTFVTRPSYTQVIGVTARNFFAAAGVLLDPPKQLFYNDRTGILMVRATLADLDIIEQAIQVLNTPPSQISIKARFAEVNLSQNKQLGFDWFLGNWLNSGGAMGVQGGSAPSFQGDPGINAPANPSGWFPGPDPSGFNRIAPSPSDNLLTSGLRGSAPALATYTGILTDPQFRVVVKALEQRGGINVLNAPEVTTVSSRQTQIKAVEVKFVVTDLDLNQTSSGGGGGVVGATGGAGAVGSSIQPIATPVELGPVLDVLPYVAADGYTIQMTIIPTLKEFTGYDLETAQLFQAQAQSVGGVPTATIRQNIPLPNFRLRQVATTAIVWDGQTVVLGGLISESETKTKDKVPFLGDLPLFGRLFRSESNIADKKNLMIFVTPSIIDPAGNRVHADEDMPFARTAIPTQTPFSPVPAPTGASTPAPSSK